MTNNAKLDMLAALWEEYKKSGQFARDEAEHNAIMEKNKRHNDEAKENRVFEWMDKIQDQEQRWGGQRGYRE